MCSLQRNYDVIRNWERFETGPLTVHVNRAYGDHALFFASNILRVAMAIQTVKMLYESLTNIFGLY